MACFTLFTLFAYCTKDTPTAAGTDIDGTTQTTLNLSGTNWRTVIPIGTDAEIIIVAVFSTDNNGYYLLENTGSKFTENFTYKLNGIHGAVTNNMLYNESAGSVIPNNAVIDIIDENTIGIGGRVFTRQ